MRRIDSAVAPQPLFDIAGTREIEAAALAALPEHALMRRAGAGVARLALAIAPHARRVWVAAGPGNNGGDGLEAALCLRQWGKDVSVLLLATDAGALPPGASAALQRARDAGVRFEVAPDGLQAGDVAVDALLGIGANRAPAGAIADAIGRLGALPCPVLAIDVPSGLHADSGRLLGSAAVVASHTLSLLTLKPGLFTAAGRDHAGSVWLEPLIDGAEQGPNPVARLVTGARGAVARRPHAAHKGSFGDVAVIGGAPGMSGAALLAARAAHSAGAGRTFLALLGPAADALAHDPLRPELMLRPAWCDSPTEVIQAATVVVGCGGGDAVRVVLPRLLSLAPRLVVDADGLNAIAGDPALFQALQRRAGHGQQTVLTPHPLEAARLLGCSTADVQADRRGTAETLAAETGAVVVLKGSGSIVAAPKQLPVICAAGNASLATAGTGDVLAGWLGGSWAESNGGSGPPSALEIAVRSVVEHGAAAEPLAPGPLRAADLVETLYRRKRGAG